MGPLRGRLGDHVHRYYSRSAEFSSFDLFAGNNESFIEAHLAIATLTETQIALQAYRDDGDLSLLEQLLTEA